MVTSENKDFAKCIVKNCQKPLKPGEEVKVGTKVFCKECAVSYFKDMIGA